MLDIVAAVNNDDVLRDNLARSPVLREPNVSLQTQRGYRSAGAAYNAALRAARHEIVVFAHQDVYLPAPWLGQLRSAMQRLDEMNSAWAVLGVYGVTAARQHVGHVWSSGLQRVLGAPFTAPVPVDSIDELLIIVRCHPRLMFDEGLPGFHLYGTDVVQQARSLGLDSYAVWAPVVHNSRPVLYLSKDYLDAYDYERLKWQDRLPIQNCIAPIVNSFPDRVRRRLRHRYESWRHRNTDRAMLDRGLDCVSLARQIGFE